MKKALVLGMIVFAVLAALLWPRVASRLERERTIAEQRSVVIPEPVKPSSSSSRSSAVSSESAASVNYDVPFTSQAPLQNWDHLHEEACEEASVLMAMRYFQGKGIDTPEDAEAAIQKLVADNAALGYAEDDTAAELAVFIQHEDPSLTAEVMENPTVEDIKRVLSEGKLVIVPAAGKQLGNPYYTYPGPEYHMLVIKGYTDGYFITNDPGTKHGKEYVYHVDVLMNAVHDWNSGQVESGAKRVIVVSK